MIGKAGGEDGERISGRAKDRKQTEQQFILDRLNLRCSMYGFSFGCEPGVQGKGRA